STVAGTTLARDTGDIGEIRVQSNFGENFPFAKSQLVSLERQNRAGAVERSAAFAVALDRSVRLHVAEQGGCEPREVATPEALRLFAASFADRVRHFALRLDEATP